MSGFTAQVTFRCGGCQRPIVKREENISENPFARCPNSRSNAVYEVFPDGSAYGHRMLEQNVVCKACGADNWFGNHILEEVAKQEQVIKCRKCKAVYQVKRFIHIDPVEQPTANETAPTA